MSKQRSRQSEAIKLLADGVPISETAKKISVARSTLHRWMDKPEFVKSLEAAKGGTLKEKVDQVEKTLSPDIIGEFTDKANRHLLGMAADALRMSKDMKLSESIRLNAMARFQSLLKDIRLINPADEKGKPRLNATERTMVKSNKDPRGILSVAK